MSTDRDLESARDLARAGVRLFLAQPDANERTGYRLPARWEQGASADPALVDAWQSGMALCAVMGGPLDLVDLDPRSYAGTELPVLPPALAVALTPSGGEHHFVLSLGLPSLDGVVPGLDYKGGDPIGNGRGFAFIAPTVRVSKADGLPHPYQWNHPPLLGRIRDAVNWASTHPLNGAHDALRRAIGLRREQRGEGRPRRVPASVAAREWVRAQEKLAADVLRWSMQGWGGEAHYGLLQHSTHLARLSPDRAEAAYVAAFAMAGVAPDADDLAKLESAVAGSIPDEVVPDAEMGAAERFLAGGAFDAGEVAGPSSRSGPPAVPDPAAQGAAFDFCDPAELDAPRPVPRARYGAFGGPDALFYEDGVHWLQGESESGKTWVALGVALEVLREGGAVILVDHEDTRTEVLARLRALGVDGDALSRLVYVAGHDVAHSDLVAHLAATERDYACLVVDGVTSALTAAGLSGRDEQEVTAWADAVPRRARMAVVVDHVVKAIDERNGMAIGSQAKKSVVTGTSFEVRCRDKFGLGRSGALELRLQKDKRGGVRASGRAVTRLRVVCGVEGSVRLVAGSGAAQGEPGGMFPGAELPAESAARVAELVAVLEADPRSAPGQPMRTLLGRLKDLGHRADDKIKRAAIRRFLAGAGVPVDLSAGGDDDD